MFFRWLHVFRPSPVAFQIGSLSIYWYGLLIVLAIFVGIIFVLYLSRFYKISKEEIWNLFFYLIIFGLIGARVFYLFYNWFYFWENPLAIFKFWQGGLSIHGAMLGGMLVLLFYTHRRKLYFRTLADLFSPALALGLAIGRWGNYFNQELYGLPTNLAWGIPIDPINRVPNYTDFEYFHPVFLYESIWCFLIFLFLVFLHGKRLRIKDDKIKRDFFLIRIGNIFLFCLILYSFGRFFFEFLRIDPQPVIFGLRLAQVLSLLIMLGVVKIWCFNSKSIL